MKRASEAGLMVIQKILWQGSESMHLRKIAAILLGLSMLLTGCSTDTAAEVGSRKEASAGVQTGALEQESAEPVTDGVSDQSNISENAHETPSSPAAEIAAQGDKEEGGVIEFIPMAQLPDLNMDPQTPFTVNDIYYTSILTPVYHENFRFQIREFTKRPARLVIDIGNTGNTNLVITDENMYYTILDEEGNEAAGSRVQGAPVTIAPGEIKRVVVTAQHPDAGLVFIDFGGESHTVGHPFYFPVLDDAVDVNDTTPYYKYGYILEDQNGNPYRIAQHFKQVIGNGKAKMTACNLMILENEKIGPIDKGDGFLAAVKVKIANTSDEVMTIDQLLVSGGGLTGVEFTEEDMALLGDRALPYTIEPQTIVEGWIPFRVRDGRDPYGIVFRTSHGGFVLEAMHSYPVYY